jgi:membrane protein DedA with SNARE-associated domain
MVEGFGAVEDLGKAFVFLFGLIGLILGAAFMYWLGWERRKKFEENASVKETVDEQVKLERKQRNNLA